MFLLKKRLKSFQLYIADEKGRRQGYGRGCNGNENANMRSDPKAKESSIKHSKIYR